jgi:hypothetical protein
VNIATAQATAPVRFDEQTLRQSFNQTPFLLEHRLVGHPLFELPRLIELAGTLPEDQVEYNSGDLPVTQDPLKTPRNGLSIRETIQRIEECRSWLVLKIVEVDPGYRQLLDLCLDPLIRFCPDMRTREAFVFVSSPDAVTPYHIDHECNFLLQIVGTKMVRMLPPNDPTVIQEADLERFYAGGSRNLLRLDSQMVARASSFELTPGLGLHFPVTAPHWVKNGPAVSISFSVTFRTSHSDRREILYRINHRMRALGLHPRPVGRSQSSDTMKFGLFNAARAIVKAVRPDRASTQKSGSRYSNGT